MINLHFFAAFMGDRSNQLEQGYFLILRTASRKPGGGGLLPKISLSLLEITIAFL
jgi:hypothetical protein